MASSRVHILGLGSIGSFIAQSLRSLAAPPPVTLLVHRESLFKELSANDWKLGLRVGEAGELRQSSGFDAELLGKTTSSTSPIRDLIVAVKASATVTALEPFKDRIGRDTTICLFQNGLGQIDDLNERLFPDPSTRPTYMCGVIRHGVYLKSASEAILSGPNGCVDIGFVEGDSARHRRFLLDTLIRSPILRCTELKQADLIRVQLLKLATNCVLNPLTALLDFRNGGLLDNAALQPLQRQLLEEISAVFENLPEIKSLAYDRSQFSVTSLETTLRDTVEKTAHNSSSMREDVRKGRRTEIDNINGWIIKRGKELGIDCPVNTCLTQLILAKNR
ncbi:2-dehydropantoate 2-reductase family protein [Penicillium longicatenatum]|uniref:2-dehydropantoate 2-reductase family protein n=1 Tax=Penicillium longicatenatum TaxID=1561947 RepID=UPI00254791AE|nr:2-dehydropantoate 2-reductase family protein [Penicillium longicatenatum]KAJ5631540.1 2-dehydropantoate 2-reductase family protein [Penicillium longicatenatum]